MAMMIEVSLSSEYGIMFFYDSKAKPEFPTEAGKNPVAATSTCLAFSVLSYVDGDARVFISNSGGILPINKEYFCGEIKCFSKGISLYDHNGFPFASVPLKDDFARLSLRMSEERNPDIVECVIENIAAF